LPSISIDPDFDLKNGNRASLFSLAGTTSRLFAVDPLVSYLKQFERRVLLVIDSEYELITSALKQSDIRDRVSA
jgi:hypothetical protein